MTVKHKCSAKTPDMYGVPNIHPCRRSGTVQHDGKWYCWQHDPEYIAEKAAERRAAWEAEGDREAAKYRRIARSARLGALVTLELAGLLRRLADWADEAVLDGGYCLGEDMGTSDYAANDPEHRDDVTVARTLAARIHEALGREVQGK